MRGVSKIGQAKGMFVYDLVVQFCTDVLVMYENPFLAFHDMIDCSE